MNISLCALQIFPKVANYQKKTSSLCSTGCSMRINSLPNDKILDYSKLKAFADNKIIATQKMKFVLWLPAFSSIPTMFSKVPSLRVVKSWDCVLKYMEKDEPIL